MEEHDLLSLKQLSATRWLSLERAVKGMRANWVALVLELQEEEAARDCPVAKGIRKRLQTLTFPALTHLLTDVLAVRVVNMTLASLEDLMNGPGEAESTFNEAFCGITLTQADAQTFSRVRTDYIVEVTKSIKKRFPSEHGGIIADLDTVINASRYPAADSALKSYGLEALERVCDHYGAHRDAAAPLVQKERMPPSESLLITSLGEMFPSTKRWLTWRW
ncbi:hypothetical protein KUCAC02_037927 [Chaenocephalus aceratus]|nr:hypothetical protein KUCAC02_037927 [Chaenocephalus aceratus]